MKIQDIQAEIIAICQEIAQLESSAAQMIVKKLLNLIERVVSENQAQKTELQELKDEINRLKGEQGKPDIKGNKKPKEDISSEEERKEAEANAEKAFNPPENESATGNDETETNKVDKKKKTRNRKPKLAKIKIDREVICPLDKNGLPNDLIFNGHVDVVVQNIIIKTDNVKYRRENYYSPSTGKSYLGALPAEIKGEYGAEIRTLIPFFKAECNMSEKRIHGFFKNFDIQISPTYISQQWTKGYSLFHKEKSEIYRNGVANSKYVQGDDTKARVNGKNYHCQIMCSDLFSAYFTTLKKDRLTILQVLTDFAPPHYCSLNR